MIIVDTNVITEFLKPRPSKIVVDWMRFAPDELYTTAINEAEARYGVETLSEGRNKREMEQLLERVFATRFAGRVLPFDSDTAKVLSIFSAQAKRQGRSFTYPDAQIIAIAKLHGATIASRDTDFDHSGVPLINPFTA
jgi:predicted nucleic acid-binding protein